MNSRSHVKAAQASPADLPVYDAVIVGAGLAGSSIAAGLAGQGWRVLLIERDRLPRHKVCGEFLSPEAQATLRGQGLYDAVAALNPITLGGAKLTTHSGRTLEFDLPGQAWGISRYALDAALATAAEQRRAELWCGVTVTGWQETSEGMVVQLRRRHEAALTHPETGEIVAVCARSLLMACGRHGLAGLLPSPATRRGDKSVQNSGVGIKCHFANVVMPAQVELYLFAGGYVGINPVENGSVNVCALASYRAFARAGRSPRALIEAMAQWNPAFGKRLQNAQALPETQCAVAPVDTRCAPFPWQGLPLVGDRAAMIPPLCGDGMAMALRSAELCGPLIDAFLRGRISWTEVGRRYRRLWHSEFDSRLRAGRLLERILLEPRSADLLVRMGARFPTVADYFVRATRGESPREGNPD